MGVVISESGMQFGEYSEEQVFHIEKSQQYVKKLMPKGIKTCEFVLMRDDKIYFLEAKASCPNENSASSSKEKKEKYDEYIQNIVLKMRHSLSLYANILLKRFNADGIPEMLRRSDLSSIKITLVLVVKNAEKEWLQPLQDVLIKKLKDEMRIWNFYFLVINEEQAKKHCFVL